MIKYLFCDLDGKLVHYRKYDTGGVDKYNGRAIAQLQRVGV